MINASRVWAAYEKARADLLAERSADGHWEGSLSSSPLATATAISALILAEQHGHRGDDRLRLGQVYQCDLSELIVGGLHWLASQQNTDGGWGDTDRSLSNVATTMLVSAAFHLTGVPARYAGMLERADASIHQQGGSAALRKRYGRDKTFVASILVNCALAGTAAWRDVPALPFELASLPMSLCRWLRLPVVSYAIPTLHAMGLARYHHAKPRNPITRILRGGTIESGLERLARMQPESGGYLESIPLTSFVVMALASTGRDEHPVVREGIQFLLSSVRGDGSWPIGTNLSIWNTTLSLQALGGTEHGSNPSLLDPHAEPPLIRWLLANQHKAVDPLSGAEPGGWGWTDQPGSVPDADDTSAALLTLADQRPIDHDPEQQTVGEAAVAAVRWLLDLQNSDGGWPIFCRGWGKLPFDRSGADLTAHVLRALSAWQDWLEGQDADRGPLPDQADAQALARRSRQATERGWKYLLAQQQDDGSWVPLWFGNQYHPEEQNPIYGTARGMAALKDLNRLDTPAALRAIAWLQGHQHDTGGWGYGVGPRGTGLPPRKCSVEETALATEALLAIDGDPAIEASAERGVAWLVDAVEANRHRECTPIGLYFAKLWYYERLYPLIFLVSALGRAVSRYED
jgi:squalene-hopene/tetraprenyl-beta-curcumene cyclase